jgi:hypothetical protein
MIGLFVLPVLGATSWWWEQISRFEYIIKYEGYEEPRYPFKIEERCYEKQR